MPFIFRPAHFVTLSPNQVLLSSVLCNVFCFFRTYSIQVVWESCTVRKNTKENAKFGIQRTVTMEEFAHGVWKLHFQSECCRSTELGVPLRIRPPRTLSLRPGTIFFLGKVPTRNLLTKRNAMARYLLMSDSHCINYCSYGAGTSGYLVFLSHMFVLRYTPLFFFSPCPLYLMRRC